MNKNVLQIFIIFVLFTLINNQLSGNSNTIVIVKSENLQIYNDVIEGFKSGFDENFPYTVEILNAKGDWDEAKTIINKINKRKNKPAAIVLLGLRAAHTGVENISEIPIIFCAVLNWKNYFIKKQNVTGISMEIPLPMLLKHYLLIKPDLKNIGIIYSKENYEKYIDKAEKQLNIYFDNINIIRGELSGSEGQKPYSLRKVKKEFKKIKDKIDCLLMIPDFKIISKRNFMYFEDQCKNNKIPLFTFTEEFVRAGALASVSTNLYNIGTQVNILARKILLRKKHPKNLRIANPMGSEFVLNSITAKDLDLEIEFLKQHMDKVY